MDSYECTTRIIEAYLAQSNATLARSGGSLQKDAPEIAKAFTTIFRAVRNAINDTEQRN